MNDIAVPEAKIEKFDTDQIRPENVGSACIYFALHAHFQR